jgi:hypothetical protein
MTKEQTMESKIRIKLGSIEVEYEGSEAFLKKELPDLMKSITELYKSVGTIIEQPEDQVNDFKPKGIKLSTKSIAAKINCTTGRSLVIAAAAHLTLAKNKESFTRKELLSEMQSASGYFKKTYGDNLSNALNGLLKSGSLTELPGGNYSLSAQKQKEIGGRLAH